MLMIMLAGDASESASEAFDETLADVTWLSALPDLDAVAIFVDDGLRQVLPQPDDDKLRSAGRAVYADRIGKGRIPFPFKNMKDVAAVTLDVGQAFLLVRVEFWHAAWIGLSFRTA